MAKSAAERCGGTSPSPRPRSNDDTKLGKKSDEGAISRVDYPNGDVYKGELKNGKRHGKGVCMYASGIVYDGDWEDDVWHGAGTYTLSVQGVVREGQWIEGKPHGWGTMKYSSGDVYEGFWVRGKPHGKGTLEYFSGNVYEGQWKEGKQHGEGTLKYPSGGIYEGVWADGQRTQEGKMTWGKYALSGKEKRKVYSVREPRSQQSQQRRLQTAKKTCDNCGVDDGQYKLRLCSGCGLALYCSAACQKAARGCHRRICDIRPELPVRDADRLALTYNRDSLVDLDAGLRYATKYMNNLKHLEINLRKLDMNDTLKLSAKRLSSLLRSKKGALDSISWFVDGAVIPGISCGGEEVWMELHGLKQLRLGYMFFDVQSVCDIISQQRNTLVVLRLGRVEIGWSKAKCRRTFAQAVSACKLLVKLHLTGCVLMDSDLKILLRDFPNLRILSLKSLKHDAAESHEFTDNSCGIIARKCPGLQELSLDFHNHLSVKGIRKIFEGCVHLRMFSTTTLQLRKADVRNLLDMAPQLLYLSLTDEIDIPDEDLSQIIEATGGRTLLQVSSGVNFEPDGISAKTRETYKCQRLKIWGRLNDSSNVANEWEDMW